VWSRRRATSFVVPQRFMKFHGRLLPRKKQPAKKPFITVITPQANDAFFAPNRFRHILKLSWPFTAAAHLRVVCGTNGPAGKKKSPLCLLVVLLAVNHSLGPYGRGQTTSFSRQRPRFFTQNKSRSRPKNRVGDSQAGDELIELE